MPDAKRKQVRIEASNGKRSYSAPVQWFEGRHQRVIDSDLFEKCKQAREGRNVHRQAEWKYKPYLLRGLIYCPACCSHPPSDSDFPSWGKMFFQTQNTKKKAYYRCGRRAVGFSCNQKGVQVTTIDDQVVSFLSNMKPPADWRKRILETMSEVLSEKS